MGDVTGISWADSTVNYWLGCHEVGPGCDNCYARHLVEDRFKRATWGADTPRVQTAEATRRKVHTYQRAAAAFREDHGRSRIVFVNSLSDTFDKAAPQAWRDEIFADIEACPDVNFYLVTKRLPNVVKMMPALGPETS